MSEETFWISIWALVGSVVITLAVLIIGYHKGFDARIVELIEKGNNPIAMRCAFSPPGDTSMCISYILNKDNKDAKDFRTD